MPGPGVIHRSIFTGTPLETAALEFIVNSTGTEMVNIPNVKNKNDNSTEEQNKSLVHQSTFYS